MQAGQGGTLPIFYTPTDRKLPMIATTDIGAEVAKLLTSDWTGKRFIELGSLGQRGPTRLRARRGPRPRGQSPGRPARGLDRRSRTHGLPKGGTWAYEEMIEAVNSGWISFGVEGTEHVEGTTSAKQVFAAAKG